MPDSVDALEHIYRPGVRSVGDVLGRSDHESVAVDGNGAAKPFSTAAEAVAWIKLGLFNPLRVGPIPGIN